MTRMCRSVLSESSDSTNLQVLCSTHSDLLRQMNWGRRRAAKSIARYNAKIREEYDLFVWFIHHNRKAQATNKKPNKLEDIFGSIYVTTTATTIMSLWPDGDNIEVKSLKVRLSKPFGTFSIRRNEYLGFKRVDTEMRGLAPTPLVQSEDDSIVETTEDEGGGELAGPGSSFPHGF